MKSTTFCSDPNNCSSSSMTSTAKSTTQITTTTNIGEKLICFSQCSTADNQTDYFCMLINISQEEQSYRDFYNNCMEPVMCPIVPCSDSLCSYVNNCNTISQSCATQHNISIVDFMPICNFFNDISNECSVSAGCTTTTSKHTTTTTPLYSQTTTLTVMTSSSGTTVLTNATSGAMCFTKCQNELNQTVYHCMYANNSQVDYLQFYDGCMGTSTLSTKAMQ